MKSIASSNDVLEYLKRSSKAHSPYETPTPQSRKLVHRLKFLLRTSTDNILF